jgi:hypothetical protein
MFMSLVLSPVTRAVETQTVNLDYQVKAAMIYKFLSYVEWPATKFPIDNSPYKICVLGTNIMSDELIAIVAGRAMNGRPIEIYSTENISQVGDAHLIFVTRDEQNLLSQIAVIAEKKSILIVTENEQGLNPESTINLRLVNGRIGFDISLKCAQKYKLKLNSRLLSVASSVDEVVHK